MEEPKLARNSITECVRYTGVCVKDGDWLQAEEDVARETTQTTQPEQPEMREPR